MLHTPKYHALKWVFFLSLIGINGVLCSSPLAAQEESSALVPDKEVIQLNIQPDGSGYYRTNIFFDPGSRSGKKLELFRKQALARADIFTLLARKDHDFKQSLSVEKDGHLNILCSFTFKRFDHFINSMGTAFMDVDPMENDTFVITFPGLFRRLHVYNDTINTVDFWNHFELFKQQFKAYSCSLIITVPGIVVSTNFPSAEGKTINYTCDVNQMTKQQYHYFSKDLHPFPFIKFVWKDAPKMTFTLLKDRLLQASMKPMKKLKVKRLSKENAANRLLAVYLDQPTLNYTYDYESGKSSLSLTAYLYMQAKNPLTSETFKVSVIDKGKGVTSIKVVTPVKPFDHNGRRTPIRLQMDLAGKKVESNRFTFGKTVLAIDMTETKSTGASKVIKESETKTIRYQANLSGVTVP